MQNNAMSFIPDWPVLVNYTIACVILFATPGPDMSLFLARTVTGGRRAGMASMIGANLGCLIHSALAALGLSALINASPAAFGVMKIIGALYLLWLAADAIRNGSSLSIRDEARREAPFWRTLLVGITVNLSNPKVVLFYVTFLPLFVSADDPAAAGKLFFLGAYLVIVSVPLAALLIFGAERAIDTLRRKPAIMRGIDWAFAGVFGFFALTILMAEAKK